MMSQRWANSSGVTTAAFAPSAARVSSAFSGRPLVTASRTRPSIPATSRRATAVPIVPSSAGVGMPIAPMTSATTMPSPTLIAVIAAK